MWGADLCLEVRVMTDFWMMLKADCIMQTHNETRTNSEHVRWLSKVIKHIFIHFLNLKYCRTHLGTSLIFNIAETHAINANQTEIKEEYKYRFCMSSALFCFVLLSCMNSLARPVFRNFVQNEERLHDFWKHLCLTCFLNNTVLQRSKLKTAKKNPFFFLFTLGANQLYITQVLGDQYSAGVEPEVQDIPTFCIFKLLAV